MLFQSFLINMDISLFKIFSDFPFIHDETFYPATNLPQNKTCTSKCAERDCLKGLDNKKKEYICSKGYNNKLVQIEGESYILNGLIFENNKVVPEGRKKVRTEYLKSEHEIDKFILKVQKTSETIRLGIDERMVKSLSMFHDFKSSMNIFFDCTQNIINSLPGTSFEGKLESSSSSYKDLYNALQLITSQLGMIDVVSNPESIAFGTKKPINLYRMFDKYMILFKHHRTFSKKNLQFEIRSNYKVQSSFCYESIEFIPLILLDNAIKYSSPYSTIQIVFKQNHKKVKISVKNIGAFVKDENETFLFDKFYRGPAGDNHTHKGLGVGLWVAKNIINSHDSRLIYDKDRSEESDVGLNIFEFEILTS